MTKDFIFIGPRDDPDRFAYGPFSSMEAAARWAYSNATALTGPPELVLYAGVNAARMIPIYTPSGSGPRITRAIRADDV